jgi:hypothetical protein
MMNYNRLPPGMEECGDILAQWWEYKQNNNPPMSEILHDERGVIVKIAALEFGPFDDDADARERAWEWYDRRHAVVSDAIAALPPVLDAEKLMAVAIGWGDEECERAKSSIDLTVFFSGPKPENARN